MVSNTAAVAKYITQEILWLRFNRHDEMYDKRMTQLENEIAKGMRLCNEERTTNVHQSKPLKTPERAPHPRDQEREALV